MSAASFTPCPPTAAANLSWLQITQGCQGTYEHQLVSAAKSAASKLPAKAPWTASTLIREDGEKFSAGSVQYFLNTDVTGGQICSEACAVGTARANSAAVPLKYIAIATVTHDRNNKAPCDRCVSALNNLSPGMVAFRIDGATGEIFNQGFIS